MSVEAWDDDDEFAVGEPLGAVEDLVAEILERPNPNHGIAGVAGMMIHEVVQEIAPRAAKHTAWMGRPAAERLAAEWDDLEDWFGSTIRAFSDNELDLLGARVAGKVWPHVGLNWLTAACETEQARRANH